MRLKTLTVLVTIALSFAASIVAQAQKAGDVIGSFAGVPVYSNGENWGKGDGPWQCTEFVKRFCAAHYWWLNAKNWTGNGVTYGDAAANDKRGLATFSNGSTTSPAPGCVIAFRGGNWGHVAIVGAVCLGRPSAIIVVEQNWSRAKAFRQLALSVGKDKSGRKTYTVLTTGAYSVSAWAAPKFFAAAPSLEPVSTTATNWGALKSAR